MKRGNLTIFHITYFSVGRSPFAKWQSCLSTAPHHPPSNPPQLPIVHKPSSDSRSQRTERPSWRKLQPADTSSGAFKGKIISKPCSNCTPPLKSKNKQTSPLLQKPNLQRDHHPPHHLPTYIIFVISARTTSDTVSNPASSLTYPQKERFVQKHLRFMK